MKNNLSFYKFLENRDKSFYKEATFNADSNVNEELLKKINYTIHLIKNITGATGDQYSPSKSLGDLHLQDDKGVHIGHEKDDPRNQKVKLQNTEDNIVNPLASLLNNQEFVNWNNLDDEQKKGYLEQINKICNSITFVRNVMDPKVAQHYDNIKNLKNPTYRLAVKEKVVDPLNFIRNVLEKSIATPAPKKPDETSNTPKEGGFWSKFTNVFGSKKK